MKKILVKLWNKAKGSRVKFTDGTIYQTVAQGVVHRMSPLRPWCGKSERRQVIKARREDREQEAMNAGILRDGRGACANCA